eukprot:jgi/Tetstr1/422809/TSEL_013600.t1
MAAGEAVVAAPESPPGAGKGARPSAESFPGNNLNSALPPLQGAPWLSQSDWIKYAVEPLQDADHQHETTSYLAIELARLRKEGRAAGGAQLRDSAAAPPPAAGAELDRAEWEAAAVAKAAEPAARVRSGEGSGKARQPAGAAGTAISADRTGSPGNSGQLSARATALQVSEAEAGHEEDAQWEDLGDDTAPAAPAAQTSLKNRLNPNNPAFDPKLVEQCRAEQAAKQALKKQKRLSARDHAWLLELAAQGGGAVQALRAPERARLLRLLDVLQVARQEYAQQVRDSFTKRLPVYAERHPASWEFLQGYVEAQRRRVQQHPQFYELLQRIPLGVQPSASDPVLTHLSTVYPYSGLPLFAAPSAGTLLHSALPGGGKQGGGACAGRAATGSGAAPPAGSLAACQVACRLAKEHGCGVVMTASSFKALTGTMLRGWEIPVCVQTLGPPDSGSPAVVFFDKPFLPRKWGTRAQQNKAWSVALRRAAASGSGAACPEAASPPQSFSMFSFGPHRILVRHRHSQMVVDETGVGRCVAVIAKADYLPPSSPREMLLDEEVAALWAALFVRCPAAVAASAGSPAVHPSAHAVLGYVSPEAGRLLALEQLNTASILGERLPGCRFDPAYACRFLFEIVSHAAAQPSGAYLYTHAPTSVPPGGGAGPLSAAPGATSSPLGRAGGAEPPHVRCYRATQSQQPKGGMPLASQPLPAAALPARPGQLYDLHAAALTAGATHAAAPNAHVPPVWQPAQPGVPQVPWTPPPASVQGHPPAAAAVPLPPSRAETAQLAHRMAALAAAAEQLRPATVLSPTGQGRGRGAGGRGRGRGQVSRKRKERLEAQAGYEVPARQLSARDIASEIAEEL